MGLRLGNGSALGSGNGNGTAQVLGFMSAARRSYGIKRAKRFHGYVFLFLLWLKITNSCKPLHRFVPGGGKNENKKKKEEGKNKNICSFLALVDVFKHKHLPFRSLCSCASVAVCFGFLFNFLHCFIASQGKLLSEHPSRYMYLLPKKAVGYSEIGELWCFSLLFLGKNIGLLYFSLTSSSPLPSLSFSYAGLDNGLLELSS